MKPYFNLEDVSQIMIGAFALAVPVSFSEEAWNLGPSLPPLNLFLIFMLSVLFLGFFAYESVFQGHIERRVAGFVARLFLAYFIAGLVFVVLLVAMGKFPLLSDPVIALKRLVVITMPASMGAIIVDGFDKEKG
jgi:uncharacterized membrane protein